MVDEAGLDEAKLRRGVSRLRLGMVLFGTIFGALIGSWDVYVALSEKQPTRLEAHEFGARYGGEQWLEVRGRLAVEHAHLRRSTHDAHVDENLGYLHVPVVAQGWRPEDRVEVLATFGPVDMNAAPDWEQLCPGPSCVTGQVRRAAMKDLDTRFPGLRFRDPPVIVNVGTEPSPPLLMAGFTLFMLICALFAGTTLAHELRSRRTS
ncbi:hypothetical protein PPSIR1_34567 [Plesiocystis pacifica SIR-1]|uniref:Uncharacterized protein n=1 Tax=Plesiocystis pacifica SIR-1 TaxID=391625 RepID=A6G7S1_9BACT|nr:hypothetical protein [Plesiocystis pacifica]EDM78149.1 hypothetical protein PPSIR1_34567 [Plesiocystis pacifica SIR-1]